MADIASDLRRTPLDAVHEMAGAKLVPFVGWRMPLQYEGIIAEHMAVRERAGLFDVSHMGQLRVQGADAIEAVQRHLSNDLARIAEQGHAQYSMLVNADGGIEDDLIVYRLAPDELLLVVNAANRAHDAQLLEGIATDESDGWAMFALQGPSALTVLASVGGGILQDRAPFRFTGLELAGHACIAATTGYTGERGCELLIPADGAVDVWKLLLAADPGLVPVGLGARDTLRLEACYPLHGSDIDATTNPHEAGLGFAAPLVARPDPLRRRLVPLRVEGRGIPRAGMSVFVGQDEVGSVTSGTMSPVLRTGIALAWVDAVVAGTGTAVELDVRGTRVPATVVERPFVRGSVR